MPPLSARCVSAPLMGHLGHRMSAVEPASEPPLGAFARARGSAPKCSVRGQAPAPANSGMGGESVHGSTSSHAPGPVPRAVLFVQMQPQLAQPVDPQRGGGCTAAGNALPGEGQLPLMHSFQQRSEQLQGGSGDRTIVVWVTLLRVLQAPGHDATR
ncbi:hypothetical protein B0H13DRAFT_1874499 [Mycena leptocephala]|nr:hypothetical protein B0H13DRAFT_1874499 [Mycena leptocephala]